MKRKILAGEVGDAPEEVEDKPVKEDEPAEEVDKDEKEETPEEEAE